MKVIAKYSCASTITANHFNCIYCYINKVNGKKYVGQAVNFKKRHYNHLNPRGEYPQVIDRAIVKYGKENFEVLILVENLKNECLVNLYECYYIDKLNTMANNGYGYNVATGGRKGNSYAGKTEEEMEIIKDKIRQKSLGRKLTEEAKAKIREHALNRPPKSQETRDKTSASVSGEKNGFYGKKHTNEAREKMSKAQKLRVGEKNSNFGNRGSKNPLSRKVVCVNLQTQELLVFHSLKIAALELSRIHGQRYISSNINTVCKCNEDKDVYFEKFGRYSKTYKGYTYYYLEDYCKKFDCDYHTLIDLHCIESEYEVVA